MEHVDDALDRGVFGRLLDVAAALFFHHANRGFGQIADHRLDVAPDVTDLGVLRRFDLDERRAGERGQPAGDLGFADAGRPDHQDIFRNDLAAQLLGQLLAAVAVAQRDRDGAFGLALADDVLVELGDDLARGEILQFQSSYAVSTVMSSLV